MKRRTLDPRITQKVIEMVATYYNTTFEAIKSDEGNRLHRQVVMYILKDALGGPLSGTCAALNVTPVKVYTASKTVSELLKTDKVLSAKIEEIKAEALIIASVPATKSEGGQAPIVVSPTRHEWRANERVEAPILSSNDTARIISKVQKAVAGVFLGPDLLQRSNPVAEVLLASDAVVFLVWDDFPRITRDEILTTFHLDLDGLYRAIGKISFVLKENGGGLKQKLAHARAVYSPT